MGMVGPCRRLFGPARSTGEVEFLMLVLGTGYSAKEPSTLEKQNQVGL
jgi:hypothetical protein